MKYLGPISNTEIKTKPGIWPPFSLFNSPSLIARGSLCSRYSPFSAHLDWPVSFVNKEHNVLFLLRWLSSLVGHSWQNYHRFPCDFPSIFPSAWLRAIF